MEPGKSNNLAEEVVPEVEPEKSKTVLEEWEEFMFSDEDTDDDFQTESEDVF